MNVTKGHKMKKQVQFKVLLDILVSVNDDLKIAREVNDIDRVKQFLEDIQGLATHLNRLINEQNVNEVINKEVL